MKAARPRGRAWLQQEAGLTLWQQLDAGGPRAQSAKLESGLSLHVSPARARLPLATRPALMAWGSL